MKPFADILATAQLHKGGVDQVEALLPKVKSTKALAKLGDDRYLSAMSLRVFQAGLKHSMVAAKWPEFEKTFKHFDPFYCAMLSDEGIEESMQNTLLIRHMRKLKAIRTNATMVLEQQKSHGSFAALIAQWPVSDIVGLWLFLKKQGGQLGGKSAARFLRAVGKDTFLLTDDVVAVLRAQGVLSTAKTPTSKRDLAAVQAAFNQWHQESGRPLSEISRVVSMVAL